MLDHYRLMSLLFLLIFLCDLSYNEVEGQKSFKTRHGDIYDCIDFYKQPSFSHPMLKNHNFHPRMRPSFLAKRSERRSPTGKDKLNIEVCSIGNVPIRMKTEGCSLGTVPIRRITKTIPQMKSFVAVDIPSGTYVAGVRTQSGSSKYGGGSMAVTVYNPPFVKPSAYSQARMQLSNGDDLIQVGWRVDPSLRGDNLTRLFIYTKTGQSHCFDAKCGFVIVSPGYTVDQVLDRVTQPGEEPCSTMFNITQAKGNWWLINFGNVLGFRPTSIFTGLRNLATTVEWAGEVYSPPGVNEPLMGSGYKPNVEDTKYVAFFYNITIVNENRTSVDVNNLKEFVTNRALYDVKDKGNVGGEFNHLAYFGGARF